MKIRCLGEFAGVKGAKELVEYIALHRAETLLAKCLVAQILAFYHLAGLPVLVIKSGDPVPVEDGVSVVVREEELYDTWSLFYVIDFPVLAARARNRIADGTVGEDWLSKFLELVGAEE